MERPIIVNGGEQVRILPFDNSEAVRGFELLHASQIKQIPAIIFTTFPLLIVLNVTSAGIYTIEDDTFANAKNLESLQMAGNELQLLGGRGVLAHATNLIVLDVSDNRIETIVDHALGGLLNLRKIALRLLGKFAISDAINLNVLHLHSNEMEMTEDGAYWRCQIWPRSNWP